MTGSADAPAVPDGSDGTGVNLPHGDVPRRKVGLSDAAVVTDGSALVTSGQGSCLGVVLYHPSVGPGGLLHAMLPESRGHPGAERKFVVEGVDALVTGMVDVGASPSSLRAKLADAAEMLRLDADGSALPSVICPDSRRGEFKGGPREESQ